MPTESAQKIHRTSAGALVGQAGDNDARAILALLDKVKRESDLPTRAALCATGIDFEGLLVLPNGSVFCVASGRVDAQGFAVDDADVGVWPAATIGGYAAVGSGSEAALAAMDAGASAARAVEIACRRNVYCRPPVHSVRLRPARPRR